jgi:glycosyltransferase involved in cell wall biosynthesis
MKKLLFITWSISYGYGTEKLMADILNQMTEKYDITILPLFKKSESKIFSEKIKILDSLIDYTEKNLDEESALNDYYKILASPSLFNKRIKEKYDCIIACNHNAPSYFASYITDTPKVVWIRGDLKELDYRNYKPVTVEYTNIKNEYDMQNNVFKQFDSIVVISDKVKQALTENFDITENVYKISNSMDKEKILTLSNEKINIPDIPTFSIMGRLDSNKNQMLLLKGARILSEYRKDFRIYLLGDGEERKTLQEYIDKHDLERNIKILGFQENPYPYIKNSIATVTTSLSEGFSLVLVESVLLNTPIISTDVGVAKELIETYHCGNLINYDEHELANIMLEYLEKQDKNPKKPIFDIGTDFSMQSELEQTIEIIEKTIDKSVKKSKMKQLPYSTEKIDYRELENYKIKENLLYILEVTKDKVKYEYLINKKLENNKLIVFNNGAVAGGNVKYPVFQRHSWAKELKTSSILCMDPTLYINGLSAGWGIGKNENYYLENSSLILKQIIEKMNIKLTDTVIYGTSAGGFLSIIMGIYLKGAKVVADNSQLNLTNWIVKPALDSVMMYCFDNIVDSLNYVERFDVIEAFKKHGYVPKIYLHVNLCSEADNSKQLVPFLMEMEKVKGLKKYQDVEVVLHYEETKGHNGLDKDDAIKVLYDILEV